jgi:outer membrane lipoprotein LolB
VNVAHLRAALHVVAAVCAFVLAGCAPMRTREREATPAAEAQQAARESALAPRTHWALSAHIGVTTSRDSGSGDLEWQQNGQAYVFTVRAPITGKTWTLRGDANGAVLEGAEAKPFADADVQRLLRDHIGWDVPLAALRAWAFGLRAAGSPARIRYDEHDLPALIEQDGWTVEYRDWLAPRAAAGTDLPLPKRVFAASGTTKIRLAVYDWSVAE